LEWRTVVMEKPLAVTIEKYLVFGDGYNIAALDFKV
jgi:hypothetical protein